VCGLDEIQDLYFEGHSRGGTDLTSNTLASMAYKANSRVSIQNALRWLQVNRRASLNKSGWLTQNVL
jgi:hypothetical protein